MYNWPRSNSSDPDNTASLCPGPCLVCEHHTVNARNISYQQWAGYFPSTRETSDRSRVETECFDERQYIYQSSFDPSVLTSWQLLRSSIDNDLALFPIDNIHPLGRVQQRVPLLYARNRHVVICALIAGCETSLDVAYKITILSGYKPVVRVSRPNLMDSRHCCIQHCHCYISLLIVLVNPRAFQIWHTLLYVDTTAYVSYGR